MTEQAAVKSKRMEIRPPSYTERIATKRREERTANNYGEERRHVYYYHGDHLGSAQVVTDYRGEVYEHIEYTPYGELWVEHAPNVEATPFRFTGKERDSETGLYYYGARYLNPQTGMWLSTDPAMGEYIPRAPMNDEARRYNQNLPGMGGVFNTVNLHVYHYGGNNPVKLLDPDGRQDRVGIYGPQDLPGIRLNDNYVLRPVPSRTPPVLPGINVLLLPGMRPRDRWINPVDGPITSGYGWRGNPMGTGGPREFHPGIDIGVPVGTSVVAAASGIVITGESPTFGNFVVLIPDSLDLNPDGNIRIITNHMSQIDVQNGARVEAGSVLGLSGNTGRSTGPHVDLMVRTDGVNTPSWAGRGENTRDPREIFNY